MANIEIKGEIVFSTKDELGIKVTNSNHGRGSNGQRPEACKGCVFNREVLEDGNIINGSVFIKGGWVNCEGPPGELRVEGVNRINGEIAGKTISSVAICDINPFELED